MYLYYYEKFNTNEIAEVLQIEPVNVRNRMSRARKKIEAILGKKPKGLGDGRARTRTIRLSSP
ncbi:RNA polymerase sigma factor [Paenibacillus sp. JCM 10914]|uniref:RNA polymerase sigma factor n=1 Tax=Paenibacillus sp. JCM 10914 TaxID=1236974 RepID=UPI0003CC4F7E|nr:sigma factor-like helix-turn-helix DNA-binding protein [Paenibacillus sp. JCM 10914]GAE09339.1 hypothetical protein JCM10914_5697 [Paenibacillus sp. JCM 10914]